MISLKKKNVIMLPIPYQWFDNRLKPDINSFVSDIIK